LKKKKKKEKGFSKNKRQKICLVTLFVFSQKKKKKKKKTNKQTNFAMNDDTIIKLQINYYDKLFFIILSQKRSKYGS
jgi:hypothetical protein